MMRITLVAAVGVALATPGFAAAQSASPGLVTGADVGGGPHVIGWTATGGRLPISIMAYAGNIGGVRVATADVDGDGRPEILAAPGSSGSTVKIFDGRSYALRHSFTPYGAWGSGVYVAGGDMTGDGKAEVVAAAGPGCCTTARIHDPLEPRRLAGFFLYGTQAEVGARIAVADFTGDGRAELAAVPASGNGTGRVSLYAMNGGGTPFRSFTALSGDPDSDVAAGNLAGGASAEVVISGDGQVRAYDPATGAVLVAIAPFGPTLDRIGVAVGDVDGDGGNDIVVARRSSDGLEVKVFAADGRLLAGFFPLDPALGAGPVSVAAADLSGDGRAEIVLGSGPTLGEPIIAVYGSNGVQLARFSYDEPLFLGGVRVATGDVVLDEGREVVTAPGPGRAAEIRLYDHDFDALVSPLRSFLAYPESFTGGVYVAVADVAGDARPEIVTAPGERFEPLVKVFSGGGSLLTSFLAFEPSYVGGVRLAAADVDADGKAEIVVARATGAPQIRVLSATGEQKIALVPFGGSAGVEIGVADLEGDGKAEILAADPSGSGGLRILDSSSGALLRTLLLPAGRATGIDTDGDGRDEIAIAPFADTGGVVRIVRANGASVSSFSPFPGFGGGVFVAAPQPSGTALSIEAKPLTAAVGIRVGGDVATFKDAAGRTSTSAFAATIDWGDDRFAVPATVVSLGGGRFAVRGTKLYLAPGPRSVVVTVRDVRGRTVRATTRIRVVESPLLTTGVRATAALDRRFEGVVAVVRDRNPLSVAGRFTARIAWGDGSHSLGTVRRRSFATFAVVGAHRYRRPGVYRVVVQVVDKESSRVATIRSTIRVRPPA